MSTSSLPIANATVIALLPVAILLIGSVTFVGGLISLVRPYVLALKPRHQQSFPSLKEQLNRLRTVAIGLALIVFAGVLSLLI